MAKKDFFWFFWFFLQNFKIFSLIVWTSIELIFGSFLGCDLWIEDEEILKVYFYFIFLEIHFINWNINEKKESIESDILLEKKYYGWISKGKLCGHDWCNWLIELLYKFEIGKCFHCHWLLNLQWKKTGEMVYWKVTTSGAFRIYVLLNKNIWCFTYQKHHIIVQLLNDSPPLILYLM